MISAEIQAETWLVELEPNWLDIDYTNAQFHKQKKKNGINQFCYTNNSARNKRK